MLESAIPRNWKEGAWTLLVSACFISFVERLVDGNYGQALVALLLALGIMSIIFFFKTWLERTNPNWVFLSSALMIFAIISIPFVEQRRFPFNSPSTSKLSKPVVETITIHDRPSADEIAKATQSIQQKLDVATLQLTRERASNEQISKEYQQQITSLQQKLTQSNTPPLNLCAAGVPINFIYHPLSRTEASNFIDALNGVVKIINELVIIENNKAFMGVSVDNPDSIHVPPMEQPWSYNLRKNGFDPTIKSLNNLKVNIESAITEIRDVLDKYKDSSFSVERAIGLDENPIVRNLPFSAVEKSLSDTISGLEYLKSQNITDETHVAMFMQPRIDSYENCISSFHKWRQTILGPQAMSALATAGKYLQ